MAGKTINELDARTTLNGKENIPFQEGNTNGRLSTDALKRYMSPDLTPYQKTVDADKKYLSAVEIDDVTSISFRVRLTRFANITLKINPTND